MDDNEEVSCQDNPTKGVSMHMSVQQVFQWCFGSTRQWLRTGALFCFSMLLVGWTLQYGFDLTPCPLCIIQRFFFGGVGVVAAFGWWHGRFSRAYLGVAWALALLGGLVAARNVYIELVPPGLNTQCIPWLQSFTNWIEVLFQATGDCSARIWTLLGLSIPEWSLIAFSLLILTLGWKLVRQPSDSSNNSLG